MERLLLSSLVISLVLAGCVHSSGEKTPREEFLDTAAKMETSTYHVEYDLNMGGLGGLGSGDLSSNTNFEIYSYEGRTKTLVSVSLLGSTQTVASFEVGDKGIVCTEGGPSLFGPGGLQCRMGEGESTLSIADTIKESYAEGELDFRINRSGTRTVIGRNCKMFTIVPNKTEGTSSTFFGDSYTTDVCLDSRKGYIAYLAVNSTQESQLGGETSSTVFSMRANSHDADVSPEDVEPPVDLVISASCTTDPRVTVFPLESIDEVTLSVNGQNSTHAVGDTHEETNISVSSSLLESGLNEIRVYSDSGTQSTSCTYFSSGTTGPDDFNFSSGTDEEGDTAALGTSLRQVFSFLS